MKKALIWTVIAASVIGYSAQAQETSPYGAPPSSMQQQAYPPQGQPYPSQGYPPQGQPYPSQPMVVQQPVSPYCQPYTDSFNIAGEARITHGTACMHPDVMRGGAVYIVPSQPFAVVVADHHHHHHDHPVYAAPPPAPTLGINVGIH